MNTLMDPKKKEIFTPLALSLMQRSGFNPYEALEFIGQVSSLRFAIRDVCEKYEWQERRELEHEYYCEYVGPYDFRVTFPENFSEPDFEWPFLFRCRGEIRFFSRGDLPQNTMDMQFYPCCNYVSPSEQKLRLDNYEAAYKQLFQTKFVGWLNGQQGFQLAWSSLIQRKSTSYNMARGWGLFVEQLEKTPDMVFIFVLDAVARALLLASFPLLFRAEISDAYPPKKTAKSQESADKVVLAINSICNYAESLGDDSLSYSSKVLRRLQEKMIKKRNRYWEARRLTSDFIRRLFIRELTLHLSNKVYPSRSTLRRRFYPDVIRLLCSLINCNPTQRYVEVLMKQCESRNSAGAIFRDSDERSLYRLRESLKHWLPEHV